MEFDNIWALLVENGASAKKEEGTRRYWDTLSPQQQQTAFTTISAKLAEGRFVHFDPIQAIKENIRTRKRRQTMTFDEYYAKYHTTEERDDWHMVNPTGSQVIYVKAG